MSKWLRRLLWFGLAAVPIVAYLWFFGIETLFCLQAWRIGRQVPIVKSAPAELAVLSVSKEAGEKVSFRGAEFEIPWADLDESKTRIVRNRATLYFRSGNSMFISISPPGSFLTTISTGDIHYQQLFTRLYGPDVLRSDYQLHNAIFQTTPRQVGLLTPTDRAAGLSAVLIMKAIMPPTTDWAIYNVRSNEFRGFQLGDPVRRPRKICLELFADDLDLEINITQAENGPTPGVTQPELNRMIQTVRRIKPAEPGFTAKPL